jgi:hypothetical protein
MYAEPHNFLRKYLIDQNIKIRSLKSTKSLFLSQIIKSLGFKWELSILNVNFVKITITKI